MMKETVGIDILATSRNCDRKIMQSARILSRHPSKIKKWNQFSQFRRTFPKVVPMEKNLSWLHFDDEPRVQERQQMQDQQSCISVFVAYPTIPSSN